LPASTTDGTSGIGLATAQTEEQVEQIKASPVATVPLGRPGTREEIAKAALFLASDLTVKLSAIPPI
jgi:NAD(P)-dependent dehydrogenase (short-subunit alcohol dehydrogenase family)